MADLLAELPQRRKAVGSHLLTLQAAPAAGGNRRSSDANDPARRRVRFEVR